MSEAILKYKARRFLDKHFSGESIDSRRILALFLPVLVDQTFLVTMSFVNTAMISSSGVTAVSAVNMIDSINNFLVNVFIAVSTGGTVIVAQYKGNGDDRMVPKAAAGTVFSVFLMAFAIGLFVIVFHGATLGLLFGGAEADVLSKAKIYLIGSCTSYCGIAIEEACCGGLRGIGETRSALMLSIITNCSYVLFNLLFITVLHMGVLGMSISVNISRYLGAACALIYLVRFNETLHLELRDLFAFDLRMLKRISFIGLPYAAEQMFFNGGKLLTQTFIVSLGTYAIAVNAICGSLAMLIQIPSNALCLTIVTVVGQCMGRQNVDDARKFLRSFNVLSSVTFTLMGVLILPFFTPLVSLFNPPGAIIPTIFTILVINNIAQIPLWSVSFIMPSGLRAAGDAKFTFIVSMLSMWLFRVVLGYILGVHTPLGIVGVWLAMDCEWGVRGAIFLHRYRGKKWYAHRLID
jgi:putative efflux protein, MATE family